jgi:signal transduction histidine kinase
VTDVLTTPVAGAVHDDTSRSRRGTARWQPVRWSGHAARLATRAGSAFRLATIQALVLSAVLTGSIVALLRTTNTGIQTIATGQLGAELESYQQAASARAAGVSLESFSTAYLRSHAVPDRDLVEVVVPGRWAVANAGGRSIASVPSIAFLAQRAPQRTSLLRRQVAARDLEVLVSPIRSVAGTTGVFLAAVDLTRLKPVQGAALRLAVGEGAVALVAGVASAYLLLRRLLRRVGGITDAAERIGRDHLAERLGDQGTRDEVGRLAVSFDSMLDRIEVAVNAQHELLSDVSHQLRTPLTVARGHLEVLGRTAASPDDVRETICLAIGELDRMGALVGRLLELGRAREPVRRNLQDVDLRAFFCDVIASCHVLAARRWLLRPVPDLVVPFDETEVRGALLNLVDNAVRATDDRGAIALSAEVTTSQIRLSVEDSGSGIPEVDREAVLNRFTRPCNETGVGTGLGLAIASAVCRAHGGVVDLSQSELGGAMVTLVLAKGDEPGRSDCGSF